MVLGGTKSLQNILCKLVRHTISYLDPSNMNRHTYSQEGEEVRQGFDPDAPHQHNPEDAHNVDAPFGIGDDEDTTDKMDRRPLVSEEAVQWESRDYSHNDQDRRTSPQYGSFREERNVWGG